MVEWAHTPPSPAVSYLCTCCSYILLSSFLFLECSVKQEVQDSFSWTAQTKGQRLQERLHSVLMCGNNHWILCQTWPGQYKLIPGQRDQSPICGNQWSPPQSPNKQMKLHISCLWLFNLFVGWSPWPGINLYWPGQVWRNIQWLLPHISLASHWATVYQFPILHLVLLVDPPTPGLETLSIAYKFVLFI